MRILKGVIYSGLLFFSIYVVISSIGVHRDSDKTYVALVESYEKLVQVYDDHLVDSELYSNVVADRVGFLKLEIEKYMHDHERSTVLNINANNWDFALMLGLVGLLVSSVLRRISNIKPQ